MSDTHLWRACGIVAGKDAEPLRRAMFEQLSSRTIALEAARAAWDRLGTGRRAAAFVSPLIAGCFLEVRAPERDADILAVWKYENERRQIAALAALDPKLHLESITLAPSATIPDRPSLDALRDAWDLVREYASRGDFLVAARVACTTGYYLRMSALLEQSRARAVLVSSDTNPYAVALVAAAQRLGKKTCFVTHGHVADGPPPLAFDLSLLDGPVVREVYERAGHIEGEVVYKGSEGIVRPMHTAGLASLRTLGVVLSILVDWRRVGVIVERLKQSLSPERIVLRLHPNETMLDPEWAEHMDLANVDVSYGDRPLTEDAAACDLVVAGNTSAHLTILKMGVPTVYLSELDDMGDDYYRFASENIVATSLDPAAIAAFYDHPTWAARFARFDAGYPDRQAACDRAVIRALQRLIAERS